MTEEECRRVLEVEGASLPPEEEAGLPITRAGILLRLWQFYDREGGNGPIGWSTPLHSVLEAAGVEEEEDFDWYLEELFGLNFSRQPVVTVDTVGDIIRVIEKRLRVACVGMSEPGCETQRVFYLIRAIAQQHASDPSKRPRPGNLVDEYFLVNSSRAYGELRGEFGWTLPVEDRVLGKLPQGATWLAVWPLSVIASIAFLAGSGVSPGMFLFGMLVWAPVCYGIIRFLSLPVWTVRTLGELARWIAQQRKEKRESLLRVLETPVSEL